jgi:threonyl-tRNA synthetase
VTKLRAAGHRVEVDEREETLGKRIRDAELEKVPYVIVWGDRETESSLAVRTRGRGQSTMSLDVLLDELEALVAPARA